MKKIIPIIVIVLVVLLILAIVLLSGFNKKQDNNIGNTVNTSKTEVKEVDELEEQLKVIKENYETWAVYDEFAKGDNVKFIITDLDHNGRLEVIVSQMVGSGSFSNNTVYELSKDLKSLVKCDYYDKNEHSESDFISMTKCDVYCDNSSNTYYYILKDYMRTNPNEYYEGIYAFSLKDGVTKEDFIASKLSYTDSENGNKEYLTYQDKYEDTISEEEYKNAAENFYDGLDKQTLNLNWRKINLTEDNMDSEIKAGLSL